MQGFKEQKGSLQQTFQTADNTKLATKAKFKTHFYGQKSEFFIKVEFNNQLVESSLFSSSKDYCKRPVKLRSVGFDGQQGPCIPIRIEKADNLNKEYLIYPEIALAPLQYLLTFSNTVRTLHNTQLNNIAFTFSADNSLLNCSFPNSRCRVRYRTLSFQKDIQDTEKWCRSEKKLLSLIGDKNNFAKEQLENALWSTCENLFLLIKNSSDCDPYYYENGIAIMGSMPINISPQDFRAGLASTDVHTFCQQLQENYSNLATLSISSSDSGNENDEEKKDGPLLTSLGIAAAATGSSASLLAYKKLQETNFKIQELQQEIEALSNEKTSIDPSQRLAELGFQNIEELDAEIKESEIKQQQTTKNIKNIDSKLEELRSLQEKLNSQKMQELARSDTIKHKQQFEKIIRKQTEESLRKLDAKEKELATNISQNAERIKDLDKNIKTMETEIKAKEQEINNANNNKTELEAKKNDLQQSLTDSKSKKTKFTNEKKQLEAEKNKLTNQINDLKKRKKKQARVEKMLKRILMKK